MSLLALITGQLWRGPQGRESKSGKQFATATIKSGAVDALWCKIVAFDETPRSALLELKAGDSVSIQGTAKLSTYEKDGEHRVSIEIVAAYVLPLRQPKKAKRSAPVREETSAPPPWDDGFGQLDEGYGGGYR